MTMRQRLLRADVLGLCAAFVLTRQIVLGLAHVSFDAGPLYEDYVQYLDVGSLQHRLWTSLYYWYSQPPLFNAFLGAVLKIFPGHAATAFQVAFLLCGLTLAISIYFLQLTVGVDRRLAWASTLLFMVSPAVLLHENWLFYTYPLTALLTLAALAHATDVARKTAWTALGYFAGLAALALSQGIFSLWWFAGLVGAHLLLERAPRAALVRAAAIPSLLVLGLAIRSYHFTGSLSTGEVFASFQLSVNTVGALPVGARRALAWEGKPSPVSLMPLYRPLAEYAPAFSPTALRTGEPLLDDPVKPGGRGHRNFNALGYLQLSRIIRADALDVLVRYPGVYLRRIGKVFAEQYFLPAERHPPIFADYPNQTRIAGWTRLFSRIVLLQRAPGQPALLLIVLLPLALGAGVRWMVRAQSTPSVVAPRVLGFMVFNVLYVSGLTIFLTGTELNRYRFFVDPFLLVLATLAAQKIVIRARVASRRRLLTAGIPRKKETFTPG